MYGSLKNPVTLVEVEAWVREENSTGVLPSQSDDIVMEHVEGEALPMVSLEARLEEVVSPLEEIPSMMQLDTLQLGEFVPFIFGAESIIGGCCREDGSHANGTGDEPDIIASGGIQDSRVDDGHKMGQEDGTESHETLFNPRTPGEYILRPGIVGICRGRVVDSVTALSIFSPSSPQPTAILFARVHTGSKTEPSDGVRLRSLNDLQFTMFPVFYIGGRFSEVLRAKSTFKF